MTVFLTKYSVQELSHMRLSAVLTPRQCHTLCLVLQVMRSISSAEKFSGKNSYALRVSPGIDFAFMIALCIVIDELFND